MDLRITLLGPPRLLVAEDEDATDRAGGKALALLAFLALEPGPHARDELAALLWSESPTSAARASLRQTLRRLRTVVGASLHIERQRVELDSAVRCDVRAFQAAVEQAPEEAAQFDVERFLSGFSINNASGFDEWADMTHQRLLRAYRDALRTATRNAMAKSHWRDAVWWAERWAACDPLSDDAVRQIAEAWYMAGDRGEALARYQAYRDRLADQAGAEPSAALRTFMDRIASEDGAPPAGTPTPTHTPESRLPEQNFDPSLVGREDAWQRLVDLWSDVVSGLGGVVLIEGESGIGKTRLSHELLQWVRAEGATVLRGRGYDPKTGVAYAPIVEAFRSGLDAPGLAGTAPEWLAELSRIVPELRERFPHLPAPSSPEDSDRRSRLFEGAAQAILGLASERPTALFIDDLQHCDQDTCALLHFLTTRVEDASVLILATLTLGDIERTAPAARLCRAIRSGTGRTTVITLPPLGETEVWQIIRELGNITAPEGARRFAAQVHAVTDGNPFHILELLKTLFAQGMLATDPASGEWVTTPAVGAGPYHQIRMPRTVHDAVAERLARLVYELRDLMVTVAVAGRGASAHLLSLVHGISRLRVAALADELVGRRLLLEEDGVYRCAHPIVQETVRNELTPARRREVHRAIALALHALIREGAVAGVAGEIARHAERGGERRLAFQAALEASDGAVRDAAFDEALSWLDLAAGVVGSDAETETVSELTTRVLDLAGWPVSPKTISRAGTPASGFARGDLDFRREG